MVIGAGSGAIVSDEAVARGWMVALVDKGPLGGGEYWANEEVPARKERGMHIHPPLNDLLEVALGNSAARRQSATS